MRILGLGFGLAVIFGGTVGVGILRLPGTIAAQMGSFWPIMLVWIVGGIYALLGAISIAELGTAMPQAGGFYVYSRRAFGPAMGFAVGWADWLMQLRRDRLCGGGSVRICRLPSRPALPLIKRQWRWRCYSSFPLCNG